MGGFECRDDLGLEARARFGKAQNTDAERQACEIRLRAERRTRTTTIDGAEQVLEPVVGRSAPVTLGRCLGLLDRVLSAQRSRMGV